MDIDTLAGPTQAETKVQFQIPVATPDVPQAQVLEDFKAGLSDYSKLYAQGNNQGPQVAASLLAKSFIDKGIDLDEELLKMVPEDVAPLLQGAIDEQRALQEQAEKKTVDSSWRERRSDNQKTYDRVITEAISFARSSLPVDKIYPLPDTAPQTTDPQDPALKAYNEKHKEILALRSQYELALKECEYIDDPASDTKSKYIPETGEYSNAKGDPDNIQRHLKTIIDAINKAYESGNITEKPFSRSFQARLVSQKVSITQGENKGEYEGFIVDDRELNPQEDKTLMELTRDIFNQLRNITRNKEVFKKEDGHYATMILTEYLSLLNSQRDRIGLNLQMQLAGEMFQLLEGVTLINGQSIVDRVTGLDLARSVNIRNAEYREAAEAANKTDTNPFANWFFGELTAGGMTRDGKPLSTDAIENLKKAMFGEHLNGFSLNTLAKLQYVANAAERQSDSILGTFFRQNEVNISKLLDIPEFKGVEVPMLTVKGITRRVFGNEGGFTREYLEQIYSKYPVEMTQGLIKDIEKMKYMKNVKFSWENWSLGLMFAYSLFGPLMVEGENTSREEE